MFIYTGLILLTFRAGSWGGSSSTEPSLQNLGAQIFFNFYNAGWSKYVILMLKDFQACRYTLAVSICVNHPWFLGSTLTINVFSFNSFFFFFFWVCFINKHIRTFFLFFSFIHVIFLLKLIV